MSHSSGLLFPPSLSGPVSSDAMANGDGLAEGFGAAGNTHVNGSLPPTAPPQSTSSPVNSQTSPGVASYPPMMLERSEGASAEVTVHTGDSLQSLRLSMPMQETELCKHKLMWSECPLYFNLILLWDVLLLWLMSASFFNSLVCAFCIWTEGFSGNLFLVVFLQLVGIWLLD